MNHRFSMQNSARFYVRTVQPLDPDKRWQCALAVELVMTGSEGFIAQYEARRAARKEAKEANLIMKRDMDLIRTLLLKLELIDLSPGAYSQLRGNEDELRILDYTSNQILAHLALMIDAGFVDAEDGGNHVGYRKITWNGHDFLDSVRDEEIWKRTKQGALAAKGFIKKQFEERTGIPL